MQIILYALAALAIALVVRKQRFSDPVIAVLLAFLWAWMGLVYHVIYFTDINKAAHLFGAFFLVQSLLFLWAGVWKQQLAFEFKADSHHLVGAAIIAYGLVIYPLLGQFVFGHKYPEAPTFGAPCPTTIFTFGILLWLGKSFPKYLLIIPFIWSVIGFNAAISLSITEDTLLLISGLLVVAIVFYEERFQHRPKTVLT
jgi:hypothetical protein